jgi:hypothetical protein
MASLLDPRMKGGLGIPDIDKEFVFGKIKEYMIAISRELHNNNNNNNNNDDDGDGDNIQQQLPLVNVHEPNDLDMMFDDLNEYYMEQQQQQRHNAADAQVALNNNNLEQHCINFVEAELLLYQQEPSIRLYKEDSSSFNCPFSWWKVNELKFPLLSELAHRLLSIPATSAPSERVLFECRANNCKRSCKVSPRDS